MKFIIPKYKIFPIFANCYFYNNAYILWLKRNWPRVAYLVCFITLPYILLRWLIYSMLDPIGGGIIAKQMKRERGEKFAHELAVVSISKNEGPYIREWVEYHKLVGVTKFYFYDNESEDDTAEVLRPYIESGLVEYHLIKGKGRQIDAYNEAVRQHKDECRWMAFIDMDEYIMPMDTTKTVPQVMDELVSKYGRGAAGVGLNWAVFGTSHHETTPPGLLTKNFVCRGLQQHWVNRHIKTICNPRLVTNYISPHYPLYRLGGYSIDDAATHRLWGWYNNPVSWETLRINHYYTKSREQYMQKISRGLGDRVGEYKMTQFHAYNLNDERDESIYPIAERMEE